LALPRFTRPSGASTMLPQGASPPSGPIAPAASTGSASATLVLKKSPAVPFAARSCASEVHAPASRRKAYAEALSTTPAMSSEATPTRSETWL
jgi:hypothetical protein